MYGDAPPPPSARIPGSSISSLSGGHLFRSNRHRRDRIGPDSPSVRPGTVVTPPAAEMRRTAPPERFAVRADCLSFTSATPGVMEFMVFVHLRGNVCIDWSMI